MQSNCLKHQYVGGPNDCSKFMNRVIPRIAIATKSFKISSVRAGWIVFVLFFVVVFFSQKCFFIRRSLNLVKRILFRLKI